MKKAIKESKETGNLYLSMLHCIQVERISQMRALNIYVKTLHAVMLPY
jgi:hypothetical protein